MNLGKYRFKLGLRLFIFVIAMVLFLFNFLKEKKFETIKTGNIIFVLDVSNSMNVKDVFYNYHSVSRLELAKKIIENNVKNTDKQVGLILFSDKMDYFIAPTLDKQTFLIYLNTVNTNNLNGGKSSFVKSLNSISKLVSPNDVVILLSDFDTDENLKNVTINSYFFPIGIGTSNGGIVKNKEGRSLYLNGSVLKSSFLKNKLLELAKANDTDYYIYTSYEKGELLPFLKDYFLNKLKNKKTTINTTEIVAFILIILAL